MIFHVQVVVEGSTEVRYLEPESRIIRISRTGKLTTGRSAAKLSSGRQGLDSRRSL